MTDHKNLTYQGADPKDTQLRQLRFLSEFDFDLVWIPGSDNVVADSLSRIFAPSVMNAIVGASAQRLDESGSSEKRESSSESTTLDRNPNTFLPASRKLPEWLKACVREDGSYDKDLAKQ